MNDLLDRLDRAEAELRQLRRENALLRSGIDPAVNVAELLALGMNVRAVCEQVARDMASERGMLGVPVC